MKQIELKIKDLKTNKLSQDFQIELINSINDGKQLKGVRFDFEDSNYLFEYNQVKYYLDNDNNIVDQNNGLFLIGYSRHWLKSGSIYVEDNSHQIWKMSDKIKWNSPFWYYTKSTATGAYLKGKTASINNIMLPLSCAIDPDTGLVYGVICDSSHIYVYEVARNGFTRLLNTIDFTIGEHYQLKSIENGILKLQHIESDITISEIDIDGASAAETGSLSGYCENVFGDFTIRHYAGSNRKVIIKNGGSIFDDAGTGIFANHDGTGINITYSVAGNKLFQFVPADAKVRIIEWDGTAFQLLDEIEYISGDENVYFQSEYTFNALLPLFKSPLMTFDYSVGLSANKAKCFYRFVQDTTLEMVDSNIIEPLADLGSYTAFIELWNSSTNSKIYKPKDKLDKITEKGFEIFYTLEADRKTLYYTNSYREILLKYFYLDEDILFIENINNLSQYVNGVNIELQNNALLIVMKSGKKILSGRDETTYYLQSLFDSKPWVFFPGEHFLALSENELSYIKDGRIITFYLPINESFDSIYYEDNFIYFQTATDGIFIFDVINQSFFRFYCPIPQVINFDNGKIICTTTTGLDYLEKCLRGELIYDKDNVPISSLTEKVIKISIGDESFSGIAINGANPGRNSIEEINSLSQISSVYRPGKKGYAGYLQSAKYKIRMNEKMNLVDPVYLFASDAIKDSLSIKII